MESVKGALAPEKADAIIDCYVDRREQVIALLQDLQAQYGYLPREALARASQKLGLPLSQLFSVATFFQAFTLEPPGRHLLTVCEGTACHVRAGQRLVDLLESDYGLKPGQTSADKRFTLETVNCLGCCAIGPVIVIDGKYQTHVGPEKLALLLKACK